MYIIGELFANHGVQLASEAAATVAVIAKQCKAGEVNACPLVVSAARISAPYRFPLVLHCLVQVSTRAASAVSLQRIVEGTADTEGGLKCHSAVLKVVEKCSADRASTVRAALALVVQALSTASLGYLSVKLPALLALCAKVRVLPAGGVVLK